MVALKMAPPARVASNVREFLEQEPSQSPRELLDKKWIRIALWLIGGTGLLIFGLWATGTIGDVYESLYTTCCWNEPWTKVMRRDPWAYVLVFVAPVVGLARWLPLRVGTRAIVAYTTFLVGYLGGHVLWQHLVPEVVRGWAPAFVFDESLMITTPSGIRVQWGSSGTGNAG